MKFQDFVEKGCKNMKDFSKRNSEVRAFFYCNGENGMVMHRVAVCACFSCTGHYPP